MLDKVKELIGQVQKMNREHPEMFSPEAVELIRRAKREAYGIVMNKGTGGKRETSGCLPVRK